MACLASLGCQFGSKMMSGVILLCLAVLGLFLLAPKEIKLSNIPDISATSDGRRV